MQESSRLHASCQESRRRWSVSVMRLLSLPIIMLLGSCAQPARYIIISEDMKDISWENTDQRYICLITEDAQKTPDILALHTKSEIRNYEQKRKDSKNPVEDVLYHLILEDYMRAEELLNQYGDGIPEYLKLVLRADLASESKDENVQASQVVKMYQEAFEVQTCDINRKLIKYRIRQLRYRR